MAKAKIAAPEVIEIPLPHGFKAIQTVAMELNALHLKQAIIPRIDSLRKAIGTLKAKKLADFCDECLTLGETAYVTVVAVSTKNDEARSYLCLCPCGASTEAFVISGAFLKAISLMGDSRTMLSKPAKSQQEVAYAT